MSTLKEKANEILQDKETNLLSENLKQGVTCMGVTGKYSVVDTTDANVSANDIFNGKIAYAAGKKVVGKFIPSEQGYYDLSQIGTPVTVQASTTLNMGDTFEGQVSDLVVSKLITPMKARAFSEDYGVGVPYLRDNNTYINGRVPIYFYNTTTKLYDVIETTNVRRVTHEWFININKEGTLALVTIPNSQYALVAEIDRENRTSTGYNFSYYDDGEAFLPNGSLLWGDYILCDKFNGSSVTSTQEGLLKWNRETHTYKHFTYTGTLKGILPPDDYANRRIFIDNGNIKKLVYLNNATRSGQTTMYCDIEVITINENNETYDVTLTRLNDIVGTTNGCMCFSPDGNYIIVLTDKSTNGGQINIYNFDKNTLEYSLLKNYDLNSLGVTVTNASNGIIYDNGILIFDKYYFDIEELNNPILLYTSSDVIRVNTPQWSARANRFYSINGSYYYLTTATQGYFYGYPAPDYIVQAAEQSVVTGKIYGIASSNIPSGQEGTAQMLFSTM